jgi:hypothetical protein
MSNEESINLVKRILIFCCNRATYSTIKGVFNEYGFMENGGG